jgi:hypothetical protein
MAVQQQEQSAARRASAAGKDISSAQNSNKRDVTEAFVWEGPSSATTVTRSIMTNGFVQEPFGAMHAVVSITSSANCPVGGIDRDNAFHLRTVRVLGAACEPFRILMVPGLMGLYRHKYEYTGANLFIPTQFGMRPVPTVSY